MKKPILHFSDSGAIPPPENVRMQALKAQHRPEDYTPPASVETPPEEWVVDGWTFEGWLARVSQAPPGKQAAPPETPMDLEEPEVDI